MKKRTVLILIIMALLSADVAFTLNFKKKKDFEKTLKTVLIPDAEKELDKLLREDAALNDSIVLYKNLLLQQSSEADGQRLMEKHHNLLGVPTTSMYSRLDEISKTLKLMDKDWLNAYSKVNKQMRPFEIGDGEYNEDAMPKGLKQKELYLSHMTVKVGSVDNVPQIPGGYRQYYASGYNDVTFDFLLDKRNFDDYIDYFCNEIKATKGQFTTTGSEGNRVFYPITSGEEIKQLLIAIKYFVNNFDNSQGVIQQQYISQTNDLIDQLLPIIEKQIKLEQARDTTASKLDMFKAQKKVAEKNVQQQKENIRFLKTTEIKKLMKVYKKSL